jgi:hypothetical protein
MCPFAVNNILFYFQHCGRRNHAQALAHGVMRRTIGDGG